MSDGAGEGSGGGDAADRAGAGRAAEGRSWDETARAELEASRARIEELERDRAIDAELVRQRPIDLEAARVLLREAVKGRPAAEIAAAAGEMRRKRPWLFESAPRSAVDAAVMGAAGEVEGADAAARLAADARASGDPRVLMRYLRARRGR